ncbi:hypothetical protein ABT121_37640, partial [Streptomyces sp. NPDC001928]
MGAAAGRGAGLTAPSAARVSIAPVSVVIVALVVVPVVLLRLALLLLPLPLLLLAPRAFPLPVVLRLAIGGLMSGQFEATVEVDRPVEAVFEYLADGRNDPQ